MKLSQRAQLLKPSPTLAMSQKAKTLAAQGKPVINLTVGEPDWQTPQVAVQGAQQALQEGFTKYTPAAGLPELKKLIAQITSEELKMEFLDSQVAVTPGAKYAIYSLLQVLIDPSDEVIIPAPYWVSYPAMVELAGGTPKIIDTTEANRFKITASDLAKAMNPKTKAFIICSPSNPTGVAYTQKELSEIAQVLLKNPQVSILSDDIYNHLYFGQENLAPHLLHVEPKLKNQTFLINGASKTFSMTGWRLGWAIGPLDVMKVLGDYLSQTTSNTANLSQRAAFSALKNQNEEVTKARELLLSKKTEAEKNLKSIPQMTWTSPDGAFYFWINIKPYLNITRPDGMKFKNSKEIAEALLEKVYVATVPGIEFGCEGYLRISFALSPQDFQTACQRMKEFFK